MPAPFRLPSLVALGVLAALVLAGCRTVVDVHVVVQPSGAGTVTVTVDLDAEAATQLGDPANLALDDLTAAGWRVTGPRSRDGGLRVVAVRPFGSPEQLAAVLDEVGGPDGIFRDTSLHLDDGFGSSSAEFRTTLQLRGDLSELSDPQLTAALGGLPLGRTPEELAALAADGSGSGTLAVRVSLPGGVDESNGTVARGVARWAAPFSGGTPTHATLTALSSERRTSTLVLAGVGAVLLVAAVVAAVVAVARRTDDG